MRQIFSHGFDISRHHLRGLYTLRLGVKFSGASSGEAPRVDAICTVYHGKDVDLEDYPAANETTKTESGFSPITFTFQGQCSTLRPWNPASCVFAAAIHLRLLHFPVKPGCTVFALDCSLRTLSHIADIVRPTGRVIAVFDRNNPNLPSPETIQRFLKRHPFVSVILEDIQDASLERYKQLLGLPEASKYAFLMGLHPRLGANSAIRKLEVAPAKLMRRIFNFLECGDTLDVSCLICCHWPEGARVDTIRRVLLTHIDIFRRLKTPGHQDVQDSSAPVDKEAGDAGAVSERVKMRSASASDEHRVWAEDQEEGESGNEAEATGEASSKKKRPSSKSKNESQSSKTWVLLDVPTDEIVQGGSGSGSDVKALLGELVQMIESMQKLASGLRTGLTAKEQLMLMPFYANRTLLVFRYSPHRDERIKKLTKRYILSPPGLGEPVVSEAAATAAASSNEAVVVAASGTTGAEESSASSSSRMPPAMGLMPVPAFGAAKPGVGKAPAVPSFAEPPRILQRAKEQPPAPPVQEPPGLSGGLPPSSAQPRPGMSPSAGPSQPPTGPPLPGGQLAGAFGSSMPADMDGPPGLPRQQGSAGPAGGKGVAAKGGSEHALAGAAFKGAADMQGKAGSRGSPQAQPQHFSDYFQQELFERRRQEAMGGPAGPGVPPDFPGQGAGWRAGGKGLSAKGGGGGGPGGGPGGPPHPHAHGGPPALSDHALAGFPFQGGLPKGAELPGKGGCRGGSSTQALQQQNLSDFLQQEFERRRQESMGGPSGPPMPDFHGQTAGWRGGHQAAAAAAHRQGGGGGCGLPGGMMGGMQSGMWGGGGSAQAQQHLPDFFHQEFERRRQEAMGAPPGPPLPDFHGQGAGGWRGGAAVAHRQGGGGGCMPGGGMMPGGGGGGGYAEEQQLQLQHHHLARQEARHEQLMQQLSRQDMQEARREQLMQQLSRQEQIQAWNNEMYQQPPPPGHGLPKGGFGGKGAGAMMRPGARGGPGAGMLPPGLGDPGAPYHAAMGADPGGNATTGSGGQGGSSDQMQPITMSF
eukprot:TRINITY_DN8935_c0_g4_i1.p1 TRINITY_DN8935_c0_g4~~TRINITY_DN8935_c0_g4_i1.p1  ORF type:complete len:1035 (+),score=249.06 TRINITY_DN8935_c0_g4_i1:179-3283(+)